MHRIPILLSNINILLLVLLVKNIYFVILINIKKGEVKTCGNMFLKD